MMVSRTRQCWMKSAPFNRENVSSSMAMMSQRSKYWTYYASGFHINMKFDLYIFVNRNYIGTKFFIVGIKLKIDKNIFIYIKK